MKVRTMVCGDQAPVFSKEEILKFTEPKLGYNKDSPGFLRSDSVKSNIKLCTVPTVPYRIKGTVEAPCLCIKMGTTQLRVRKATVI